MSRPVTFFVPGRIEVLGKHTDYAGGRSLLVATQQGITLEARPASWGEIRITDVDTGRSVVLPLSPEGFASRSWERYPAVVVRRVARDFPGLEGGADLSFSSTLPAAAGMSSSSALVVAVFLGTAAALGIEGRDDFRRHFGGGLRGDRADRERLATYLAAVESGRPFGPLGGGREGEGVGTDGGSEDHAAILCAEAGHIVRYGFRPTRFEGVVAMPKGWIFAVAASGVIAEKAEGARDAYNRLSDEARRIAEVWRDRSGGDEPHIGAILTSSPGARTKLEELLTMTSDRALVGSSDRADGSALIERLRQFATESDDLVPLAAEALAHSEMDALGRTVARSQALAEDVLRNQVPETMHLVRAARKLGAPAASAFGAGFGGAVWALVPRPRADTFLDEWRVRYLARFPEREGASRFLWTDAEAGAVRLG